MQSRGCGRCRADFPLAVQGSTPFLHRVAMVVLVASGPVRSVENVQAEHVQRSKSMINSETHSDLIFMVEKRPVYSHKAIVAAHSEYLAAQLSGFFGDSCGPIYVENIGYDVFVNVILEYIYVGTFRAPGTSDAFHVLALADLWQLEDLIALGGGQRCWQVRKTSQGRVQVLVLGQPGDPPD